jgi:hypothetical protein
MRCNPLWTSVCLSLAPFPRTPKYSLSNRCSNSKLVKMGNPYATKPGLWCVVSCRDGIDVDETYAPVFKYASLRFLVSHCCSEKIDITHLDIKTAFLNAPLEETVWCDPPPGSTISPGHKLRLKRHCMASSRPPEHGIRSSLKPSPPLDSPPPQQTHAYTQWSHHQGSVSL